MPPTPKTRVAHPFATRKGGVAPAQTRTIPHTLQPATLLLLLTPPALTQTLSSLQGTLTDPTDATVPNARILIRNTDTGSSRTLTASPTGAFRANGLAPGAYTVQAETPTLRTRHPLRLTLTLGSSQELHLRLDPTAVRQSTTVTGRAATVEGNTTSPTPNTAEPSLNTFLPGLTVTYLPNRDRDFAQFARLTATAVPDDDDNALSLGGQRADTLLTTLDGASFTSPLFGGPRGAEDSTLFLPLTAIREFEVVRTGTDAATGRTTAGLVNVATKSGANRPRGEAFYTGHPAAFTAADAFGHPLAATENAFGASYGLPLRRDKAFAFFSIEKYLLTSPFYTSFDPQPPNTPIPATLLAQQGQVPEHHAPLAAFTRVDLNLTPASTLSLSLALDRIRSTNLGDGLSRSPATAAFASSLSGQSLTARAGLTSVLTPHLFNNAVAAWSTDHRNLQPNSTAPEQFINGFGILGGSADGQHLYTAQRTQLLDDLTLTRGRNALTLGGSLSVEPSYEQQEPNTNARFDYNSLPDLLANTPRRFQQTLFTTTPRYRGTVTQLGLYADAHLALTPTLFLTAGLRWDAQFNPQPPSPNPALTVTQRIPDSLRQFQPRLGLAWNPDPKTVLRLSAGLYAAPTPATWFHPVFTGSGTQTLTLDSAFDPTLLTSTPQALPAAPTGLTNYHALVYGISPTFRNPTSAQLAASLDRQLLPKLALTLGYIHSGTWALPRELDQNLAPPTIATNGTPLFLAPRPIPGIGRLLVLQSNAHASYNAATLSLNAPISRRSTLLANYTFSRTSDDDSSTGPYSPSTALNPFNLAAERAYSNLDVRHNLNLNAIFNLPAGLKLNPILLARSGQPYTPIIGFDTQNEANDRNDRAILNGLVAPRNLLRQPAFADLDLRFVKDFTLKGEGHHLDLFADLFNLAGFGNRRFAPGAQGLVGTPNQPVFSAGLPLYAPGVTRFGGPRTLQLTARLVGF